MGVVIAASMYGDTRIGSVQRGRKLGRPDMPVVTEAEMTASAEAGA